MLYSLFCSLIVLLQVNAFTTSFRSTKLNKLRSITKTSMLLDGSNFLQSTSSLLNVVTQTVKPEGYEYGAVSAPDWVLPVTAVLVILTAAIPILLRPGEKALEQQRLDEEAKNSQFNKRKNKDL